MENLTEYNRIAQACPNHRLRMTSSERVLVNERYDSATESPANVKAYIYTHACTTCGATRTQTIINK